MPDGQELSSQTPGKSSWWKLKDSPVSIHWEEIKIVENPKYFIRRWISDNGQAHGLISPTEIREMEGGLTGDDEPKWTEYKKK